MSTIKITKYILICINEELSVVGEATAYTTEKDARKAMREDVTQTRKTLRSEGMHPTTEKGEVTVMRYGDEYLYAWHVIPVTIDTGILPVR